jgi:uncharacterized protein YrzB (UPF0473 family)
VVGHGRGGSLSFRSAGREGFCSRLREMEGCSDSGKNSVRVVNAREEEEEEEEYSRL